MRGPVATADSVPGVDWLGDHGLDLFGWAGSALLIVSLLQTRVLRFRLLNLCASVSLVVFNALVGVWPMVGMNLATTAINLVFITRLLRERHDAAAFEVLRVGPREAYFQHFLTVHARDIATFYPHWHGTEADDLAYQVQRGDETVGIVLIRPEGPDGPDGLVAQVVLDYVTPRFRDFSPGEFVWAGVEGLRDRGFRRVVTPPGMVAPYYDRLDVGFRREGASYVLDL
jgi:hypothetical protein